MSTVIEEPAEAVEVFSIASAEHLAEYRLRITFTDGVVREVNFGPFLRNSRHPAMREYLDEAKFRDFTVEDGFLHWHDFNLVFPMADLHDGCIH